MLNRTPFYHNHVILNAKIVDFAGWEMPIQYTTIKQEHEAVRTAAGLFDISHMGQVFVWGPQAKNYLQTLTTNDVSKLSVGQAQYAHLLNMKGTVIDDIYIYQIEEDKYLVVVNASRKEADMAWMEKNKTQFDVQLMEAPQGAGLALQGPKAVEIVDKICMPATHLAKNEIGNFPIGEISALISRTGYTGEDGFEFFAPAGHLLILWEQLFKVGKDFGLAPCGLGARDTLRTEVGFPLYGHELDEEHTPLEARLSWVVKFDKGNFIGRDALLKQKSDGLKQKLFGFKVESGGVARPGGKILINNKEVSTVASGTFSPTLGYPIGLAFLPTDTNQEGTPLTIQQGTRELKALTVKLPFYKPLVRST